jgi:DNA-binding NtrC family response regulator
LNVVCINLPPLRDRREEIPTLTDYFLKKYSVQYHKPFTEVSPETTRLFLDYDWPGNVRELENVIKRAVVLGTEAPIRKEMQHSIAAAAQRLSGQPAPVNGRALAASEESVRTSAEAAPTPPSPASLAAAAADTVHYSLKDISRTAARGAERELILRMLHQTRWNRKETAAILGISYKALLYKIKENGLDKA